MLNILVMIILIIILFIIIQLHIGIRIALIYEKKGRTFKGCLKIIILKKISIYTIRFPEESEDEDDDDAEDGEGTDFRRMFELMKPCLEDINEYLKSFVKCIHVKKLENHLIFGLDSYADTAKYIGYIWSLLIIVNKSHENARLSAEPSFNGSILDASGDNQLEINLLKVLPPTLRLLSKKEVRTLIRGVRSGQ